MQLADVEHYAVVAVFLLSVVGIVARWAILEWSAVRHTWKQRNRDTENS